MGYLCPVCEEPFADSQQCANHLAVTAILHGGDHETWLDETVGAADTTDAANTVDTSVDWESLPRATLAELVAEHATETDDHEHPGDHTHPVDHAAHATQGEHTQQRTRHDLQAGGPHNQSAITESAAAVEGLDAEAQAILREARELTETMVQCEADESEDS